MTSDAEHREAFYAVYKDEFRKRSFSERYVASKAAYRPGTLVATCPLRALQALDRGNQLRRRTSVRAGGGQVRRLIQKSRDDRSR